MRYRQSSDVEVEGKVIFSSFRAIPFERVMFCGHLVGPYHSQDQILGLDLHPASLSPTSPKNLLIHGLPLNPFCTKLQATGSGEAVIEASLPERLQGYKGLGYQSSQDWEILTFGGLCESHGFHVLTFTTVSCTQTGWEQRSSPHVCCLLEWILISHEKSSGTSLISSQTVREPHHSHMVLSCKNIHMPSGQWQLALSLAQ